MALNIRTGVRQFPFSLSFSLALIEKVCGVIGKVNNILTFSFTLLIRMQKGGR
jgi:hypothetical protein